MYVRLAGANFKCAQRRIAHAGNRRGRWARMRGQAQPRTRSRPAGGGIVGSRESREEPWRAHHDGEYADDAMEDPSRAFHSASHSVVLACWKRSKIMILLRARSSPGKGLIDGCLAPPAAAVSAATATGGTAVPIRARPRFADAQGAPSHLRRIQSRNRFARLRLIGHLHEAEALRPTGFPIHDDAGICHATVLTEQFGQLIRANRVRHVSDVYLQCVLLAPTAAQRALRAGRDLSNNTPLRGVSPSVFCRMCRSSAQAANLLRSAALAL